MKIFVTGATGILGKRVVKTLISKNFLPVALSRSRENENFLKDLGVEARSASLFNADEIELVTRDCDAVLHLATSIPKKSSPKIKDWEMNDRIRVDGTKNLVRAINKNNIQVFICQSITALYGEQHGNYVKDISGIPQTKIKMLKSAMEMENMIREQINDRSLIIRFGSFYSKDTYHTKQLVSSIRNGRMPIFGKGDYYWNFIHTDDAADAIVYCLENFRRYRGKQLAITDFNPVFASDALMQLSEITHSKKPFSIPPIIAKVLLGRNTYRFLTNSYRISKDPLLKDWCPRYPDFISGMKEIIEHSN